jgi:uncharacterized protein (TIGR02328 family)
LVENGLLPKSQLLAQWRELNSIFKKQDKHILINYVYEYDKKDLLFYSKLVIKELEKRNIKIKSWENYHKYLWGTFCDDVKDPFKRHHNTQYLIQCFYNLQEKYDRGQKDFTREQYENLEDFIKGELKI